MIATTPMPKAQTQLGQGLADEVTDDGILSGLRRLDRHALEQLAFRHGRDLAMAAHAYLGNAHDAEDIAQETLMSAWDGARRASPGTKLRPWLFGILFNRCRKHRRSMWRRLLREKKFAQGRTASAGDEPETQERLEKLRCSLAMLDGVCREVIILRFQQCMTVADAAHVLNIPEGTVKSRTHAALGKLKTLMEQQHDRTR